MKSVFVIVTNLIASEIDKKTFCNNFGRGGKENVHPNHFAKTVLHGKIHTVESPTDSFTKRIASCPLSR